MAKQSISLPKDKQLRIQTDAVTSGYYYTHNPGSEPSNITAFSASADITITAKNFERKYLIHTTGNSATLTESYPDDSAADNTTSLNDLKNKVDIRTNTYVEDGAVDLDYNVHLIGNDSDSPVVLTLPAISGAVQGAPHLFIQTDPGTGDGELRSQANETITDGTGATFDYVAFDDTAAGSNITVKAIDDTWVVVAQNNITLSNDA